MDINWELFLEELTKFSQKIWSGISIPLWNDVILPLHNAIPDFIEYVSLVFLILFMIFTFLRKKIWIFLNNKYGIQ